MELLIWQARTSEGITLEKLSELTGISKSALDNYENEITYPNILQLEKIARALNTKIENLYKSEYK